MLARAGVGFQLKLSELAWDGEIFGFRCGCLDVSVADQGGVEHEQLPLLMAELLDEARQRGFRFLTTRIDATETGMINPCLQNGGILVDTELTFQKGRAATAASDPPAGFSVQRLDTYWDDALGEIADTLGHSRFFTDPNIADETARRLWQRSIYNSCIGRASYSIVAFCGENPAGLINVFERGGASDIFLIAVLPAYQGKGLGRAMMACYEEHLGPQIERQIVETQLVNFPAQKLYTSMGYRCVRAKHTIHFWL